MAKLVKVRLRYMRAGPDGVFEPGSVIEVTEKVAKQMIENGQAVAAEESEVEAATAPAPEIAATTARPGRKRAAPPEEAPPATDG